ncbi:putative fungal specific transcription factor [Tuber indicum]|nr:putative fungal specific transcription factor [Tuber indicum]
MALAGTTATAAAPSSAISATTNSAPQPTTDSNSAAAGQKRSAAAAGNTSGTNFRPVKRRASKACQCCRARKVRCNVVEHGAPCTNCRLDEVECIITESRRRKKLWGTKVDNTGSASDTGADTTAQRQTNASPPERKTSLCRKNETHISGSPSAMPIDLPSDKESGGHVPHLIYQAQGLRMGRDRRASYASSHESLPSLANSLSTQTSSSSSHPRRLFTIPQACIELPAFVKPTPIKIPLDDLEYLTKKGALTLPEEPLRSELLRSHFDFVHPYMPLLNRKDFLRSVTSDDGSKGKISLLLFQAVMFAGSAFVDMESLRAAGYPTRKAARKAFFTKARALYDFDHEQDRMSLVQAILLMTYWYETPDDQKDTWHWMGVAISLSHTIGLHRDPANSNMDPDRKKLWKRIWWSCFMRDRLVALGMRRPTRIKSEDCDVPMLTLDDFSIDTGPDGEEDSMFWSYGERQRKEMESRRQRELAILCIQKAKLCKVISRVLSAQYSVLNTNQGSLAADGSTRTTMMLLPKKLDPECCQVERCDEELARWVQELPEEAIYRPVGVNTPVDEVLTLHRNLLHMCYYTTVSALHRPQVLPSAPAPWPAQRNGSELQEISRRKVRQAASEITHLAEELIDLDLVKYLPTTGVTVMLPAVIIHLLDIKSSNALTRELSLEGFGLCMQVMQGLRQSYSAADYATHFLEAAIKKAEIQVAGHKKLSQRRRARYHHHFDHLTPQKPTAIGSPHSTQFSGNAIAIPASAPPSNAALTPPPDIENTNMPDATPLDENELQLKLETFLQSPSSPKQDDHQTPTLHSLPQNSAATFTIGSNGVLRVREELLFPSERSAPMTPYLSVPRATDDEDRDLDALLNLDGQDNDPFFGHYDEAPLMGQKRFDGGTRAFDLVGNSSTWLEEDMSRILDGVDFDIDDVIQVLETEIN